MKSIDPSTLSIKERHGLLLTAVGPRPIAWVSTVNDEGKPNLAPFSFFNIFSSNPPVLIFSPALSGRTGKTKHTLDNVIAHPECVIHVVTADLLDRMVMTSLEYPEGVSEFEKAGLTAIKSDVVQPLRVAEAAVQLECKVLEVNTLGTEGAAGNLVICEVVRIHVDERILNDEGQIVQEKLELVGRAGGPHYTKAYGDALFPISSNPMHVAVGYDSIPSFARESKELSAAHLTALAKSLQLPDETLVNEHKLMELSELFSADFDDLSVQNKLCEIAAEKIDTDDTVAAWMTLLSYNP